MDWILFAMTFTLFASIMLIISSFVIGETYDFSETSKTTWIIWIYLGLIVGTITLFIQTWGQRFIDSTRTAILFSLEPIFATVFGIIFADEPITFQFFTGAVFIMLAIIISSISVKKNQILSMT
jgi:drug/metabolite transporter (DMT)-like permease